MRLGSFAILALSLGLVAPAHAVPAPRVSIASLSQLTVPDAPFDTAANADADVDAAIARARRSGKRVMIDLGGNWCADCRILSGLMALPEMDAFLKAHYEIVDVDIGRFNKNLQIPARYGITERLAGVPAILIVTPEGKLINRDRVSAIEDARHMTPQALADWLAQWAK
jgi:thiol-disulfide isomerase/thioredoxin